jgi:glycosyltransferase involved in cell wall biosynthesis
MHFLFISTILGTIGGIETLIIRMSKWLVDRGHKVTLLANFIPVSRELFHKDLRIVEANNQLTELCFYYKSKKVWADLKIERPDVIKTFDLTASWIGTVISTRIRPAPKVIFGNYFAYAIPTERNPLKYATFRLFLLNLRRNFLDDSIICMSEEQISEFRCHYGHHRKPNFWPLPVEDLSRSRPDRTPQWGRIVSIGRLERMKEYNIYMIDVIDRLRQRGLPVKWIVYGDGVLGNDMKARINALGLGEAIELKGILPYTEFAAALRDAYVFVGMGTAIIEAALCRVPGIVALAYDTTGVTYGPLYRFTFGNCGSLMETPPATTVEAEIERLLKFSRQEYEAEMQMTREYAQRYEMDGTMERFLEIVEKASVPRASRGLFYLFYLHSIALRFRYKIEHGSNRDRHSRVK